MARKSKWQQEAELLHAYLFAVIDACSVPMPAIGHTSEEWDTYEARSRWRLNQISTATVTASYGDPDKIRSAITRLKTAVAEPLGYPVEPPQAPPPADIDAVPAVKP